MKQKFYKCSVCGQIVAMVKETPVPVMCCGKPMEEMIAGNIQINPNIRIRIMTLEENG